MPTAVSYVPFLGKSDSDAPAFSPVAEMFSYASWERMCQLERWRIEVTAFQTHVGKVLSMLAVLGELFGGIPLGDLFALGDLLLEPGLPAGLGDGESVS